MLVLRHGDGPLPHSINQHFLPVGIHYKTMYYVFKCDGTNGRLESTGILENCADITTQTKSWHRRENVEL